MEHRHDLGKILLDGLPPDERKHVIDVIRQGDAEKLRRKRAEKRIPSQEGDLGAAFGEADEFADASEFAAD